MRYRHLILALLALLLVASVVSAQENATEEPTATDEAVITVAPTEEAELPTQQITPSSETSATPTAATTTQPDPTETEAFILYTVQRGDTLGRIATRFATTSTAIAQLNGILNFNLIYVGQELRIPSSNITPTNPAEDLPTVTQTPALTSTLAPTPTAITGGENTYVVQPGDTLFRIAVRFNTTTANLVALNNLSNANIIYVGQRLIVSGTSGVTPVPATPSMTTTAVTTAGATAEEIPETAVDLESFDYGVTAFLLGNDINDSVTALGELGVNWVRLEVQWSDLEAEQGEIDFTQLDSVIDALEGAEKSILLMITGAPDWARTSLDEDGPPDDFATFEAFMSALATEYAGRIDAYQIWNEPNLRREWNSDRYEIRADHYVNLLSSAYSAVKAVDADALVIAAGLAPTGFNDGINAIEDRVYLQDMYSNGVIEVSDAIAAHPGGWSNPPDAVCCTQPAGVETHFESPTFFFKNTLQDYRDIMVRNNDNRPLWITKFGWGTAEDTNPPGADYVYINYTDLAEQAIYTPRAFDIAAELGYVGPMFLYNLNGCTDTPLRAERCFTSLVSPEGSLRPVFSAVASLDKSNAASNR